MANKKAKSPKAKKNTKKKITQTKKGIQTKKVMQTKKGNQNKKINTIKNDSKQENNQERTLVTKDKVKYNVAITEPDLLKKKVTSTEKITDNSDKPPKKNEIAQSISKVAIVKNKMSKNSKPKNKIIAALANAKNNITRWIKEKNKVIPINKQNNNQQNNNNNQQNNKHNY